VYNLLVDPDVEAGAVVRDNPLIGVDYMPANIELSGAETQLINEIGRETFLKEKLRSILPRYDFIVIDCPPALSLITINAFVASDQVIIPLQCEYFGLKGMQQLQRSVERVRIKLNPKLHVAGILPTIFKARTLHSREVLELVRQHFGDLVYDFAVKDSIRFAESPLAAVSILQYASASEGAGAYRKLAEAVLNGNHA
jgi:chromosome partitioning protein